MLSMISSTLGMNQNIINEHNHKLIQILMKNPIHIFHKHTRSISHTKRHYKILIVTIPCPKSSLLNILSFHTNLMITIPQINLTENKSTNQLIHQIINHRNWILVLNRHLVQLSIINTNLIETSFSLTYKTGAPHGDTL